MFGGADGTVSSSQNGTTSASATYNQTDSNIKTTVDTWYKTNIYDRDLDKYVADAIFCNDRSTAPSGSTWWTRENANNKGFGSNPTAFGAAHRTFDSSFQATTPTPQFTCTNKNDAFTVDDTTKGNGALSYKVGLITADEIVAAGSGKYETVNRNYYLYKSSYYWYWSFSPRYFDGNSAIMFVVYERGSLISAYVNYTGAVAPVINISAEYATKLEGSGTAADPYQIPGVA